MPILDVVEAFLWGFRFDFAATFAVLSPFIVVSFIPIPVRNQRLLDLGTWIAFSALSVPLLIANVVDIEMVNFTGRRSTFDNLFLFSEVQGKWVDFAKTYWPLVILQFLILFSIPMLSAFGLSKIRQTWSSNQQSPRRLSDYRFWAANILIYLCMVIGAVVAIRGGFQKKPLNLSHAQLFKKPVLNNLIMNSTFAIIKTIGNQRLENVKFFDDLDKMKPYLNGYAVDFKPSLLKGHRLAGQQNVVILILESFALEYMGEVNGKNDNFTPYLDKLTRDSLFFTNAFANGRRSIEGVPAVLASVPALMDEPFVSSSYVGNEISGIGRILGTRGYLSAFFHGGQNGTMYFDTFAKTAGFQNYFGANEYPNTADNDGVWGIYDEPFMQWSIEQINSLSQKGSRPFLMSLFSLSSHHPYKIPEKYKDRFPKGELEVLSSIAYTDYSLERFFESARTQPWFKNTLFVITADHAVKHFRKKYMNDLGDYRIPIILYHPSVNCNQLLGKKKKIEVEKNVAQQIDIVPTILDFLDFNLEKQNRLGRSLFVTGSKSVTLFLDGRYFSIGPQNYLRWNGAGESGESFLSTDGSIIDNPAPPAQRDREFLRFSLKAAIQYFNEGMGKNLLVR